MKKIMSFLLVVFASFFVLLLLSSTSVSAKSINTNSENNIDLSKSLSERNVDNDGYKLDNRYLIGGDGVHYTLKQTITGNNKSFREHELQLDGEYQHYGRNIASYLVERLLKRKTWYVSKRYTGEDASTIYIKIVTDVYSNSARTHLLHRYTQYYTLPKKW